MKKYLCILVLLFFTGIAAIAQTAIISTSRDNIKRGVTASYTAADGLVFTFDQKLMDESDKKALATGFFVVKEEFTLTRAECKALKVPNNRLITIKKGRWLITKVKGFDSCKPGFAINDNGTK